MHAYSGGTVATAGFQRAWRSRPPPLREAHGLIWLWRREARDAYPELPYFHESGKRLAHRNGHRRMAGPLRARDREPVGCRASGLRAPHDHRRRRTEVSSPGPYVEADRLGIQVWVSNALDEGQRPRPIAELKAAAARVGAEPQFQISGVAAEHQPASQEFHRLRSGERAADALLSARVPQDPQSGARMAVRKADGAQQPLHPQPGPARGGDANASQQRAGARRQADRGGSRHRPVSPPPCEPAGARDGRRRLRAAN